MADYEKKYYRLIEAYYRYMSILYDDDFEDDLREIDALVGIENFMKDSFDENVTAMANRYENLYKKELAEKETKD